MAHYGSKLSSAGNKVINRFGHIAGNNGIKGAMGEEQ